MIKFLCQKQRQNFKFFRSKFLGQNLVALFITNLASFHGPQAGVHAEIYREERPKKITTKKQVFSGKVLATAAFNE